MKKIALFTSIGLALLSACSSEPTEDITKAKSYDLIGNSGEIIGSIAISDEDSGVRLVVTARGISPGEHGIHFHHTGSCLTPDFKSAGGHINPMGKAHGLNNPDGPDNADMPNAVADEDGNVKFEYLNERVSLNGATHRPALLDENGSALVMHLNPDDGITQPIGGAGPRIACAEIN